MRCTGWQILLPRGSCGQSDRCRGARIGWRFRGGRADRIGLRLICWVGGIARLLIIFTGLFARCWHLGGGLFGRLWRRRGGRPLLRRLRRLGCWSHLHAQMHPYGLWFEDWHWHRGRWPPGLHSYRLLIWPSPFVWRYRWLWTYWNRKSTKFPVDWSMIFSQVFVLLVRRYL